MLAAAPLAMAQTYGFGCITNNSLTNCSASASQLLETESAFSATQSLFTFWNTGRLAMSITDVYLDDRAVPLLAMPMSIMNGPGVGSSQGDSPPNLLGANSMAVPFKTTAGFLAGSDRPVSTSDVNPGESVGIRFADAAGRSFAPASR